jgi:hypothetical protein
MARQAMGRNHDDNDNHDTKALHAHHQPLYSHNYPLRPFATVARAQLPTSVMSATKRKFNALLQGLSDSRTGLEDGSSAYDALLQKRRRLGFPASTAPKFDSQTNSPTDLAASLSQKRRAQQQADKDQQTKKPAVRYCPTDRDELLRRLETFQDITRWTPKPDRISEFEWTKRGWLCQAKETVRCVLCSKELVIKLSRANKSTEETQDGDETTASTTEALVDKYLELIVSGHQEECLWRKRGCDGMFVALDFHRPV